MNLIMWLWTGTDSPLTSKCQDYNHVLPPPTLYFCCLRKTLIFRIHYVTRDGFELVSWLLLQYWDCRWIPFFFLFFKRQSSRQPGLYSQFQEAYQNGLLYVTTWDFLILLSGISRFLQVSVIRIMPSVFWLAYLCTYNLYIREILFWFLK